MFSIEGLEREDLPFNMGLDFGATASNLGQFRVQDLGSRIGQQWQGFTPDCLHRRNTRERNMVLIPIADAKAFRPKL